MKLEPGRNSLSGRPEFLRPAVPVQTSAPILERRCVACNLLGVVQEVEGELLNSVAIELQFLEAANEVVAKQKIAGRLAAKGWRYKFHLGRHAMERFICRPCMEAHKEMANEFRRKRSNELKASVSGDNYYLNLCGD